jgi:hypothetical protein
MRDTGRLAIHRDVWYPSKVTLEAYRRMRSVSGYTPELDIVVVAPDGNSPLLSFRLFSPKLGGTLYISPLRHDSRTQKVYMGKPLDRPQ